MARFDNDASACYNRNIVILGMMAARRCGMPEMSVKTHAETLQDMKYTIKTKHGMSSNHYTGTPDSPLYGTGQGRSASPSVWLSLVVVMMNTLDHMTSEHITFQSPDPDAPQLNHSRLLDAFVDDTSLSIDDKGDTTHNDLIRRLTNLAQTWENILTYSGGALNLQKCCYYNMYWEWVNGRPRISEGTNNEANSHKVKIVSSTSHDNSSNTIRQTDTQDPNRILGVYLSPNGSFTKHLQVMKEKTDKYSIRLKSPHLTASDIRIFHRTIYSPAMKYSLPALAVDEEQLHSIQTKDLQLPYKDWEYRAKSRQHFDSGHPMWQDLTF